MLLIGKHGMAVFKGKVAPPLIDIIEIPRPISWDIGRYNKSIAYSWVVEVGCDNYAY